MSESNRTREWVAERAEGSILYKGFDSAIVGIAQRCAQPPLVVYNLDRMVRVLVERDGMSEEDAREYIEFNIAGAWLGERTPALLEPLTQRRGRRPGRLRNTNAEIERLRDALRNIAANNDEPYARDYAKDVLARRSVP